MAADANSKPINLQASVYGEHLASIEKLLDSAPTCHSLPLLEQPNIHAMEIILLCKAMYLGGLDVSLQLKPMPTQVRAVRSLEQGISDIFVNSVWSYLHSEKLLMSSPLLKKNQYEKGVYVSPNNTPLLMTTEVANLKNHTAITGNTWYVDRKVLDCFRFEQEYVSKFPQMVRMVYTQRVDFFLLTFSQNPDLVFDEFGVTLVPIPGIKFLMPDSLHFFVSKKHPQAEKILAGINRGLAVLDELGDLRRAYQSIGLFRDDTADWKGYSCPSVQQINFEY